MEEAAERSALWDAEVRGSLDACDTGQGQVVDSCSSVCIKHVVVQ